MRIKKRVNFIGLCLTALLLSACGSSPEFTDQSGNPFKLKEYAGEWVLINYWATWCTPCVKEVPELNALEQADNNIRVLGVDYDNSPADKLSQSIQKLDIQFRVFQQNPAPQLEITLPDVLPATYILNPEGKVVKQLLGPQTQASLEKAVNELKAAG